MESSSCEATGNQAARPVVDQPHAVCFDVSAAVPPNVSGGERSWITARIFAPVSPPAGRLKVVTCLHGGSYDWRYFHIQVPGRSDYSIAEYLAARGYVVIVPDQLGVGDSSRPVVPRNADRHVVAAASRAVVEAAHVRLNDGTLHPALAPCADPVKIGIGHSLGAFVLVTQQADWADFDLTVVLGSTNRGLQAAEEGDNLHSSSFDEDASPFFVPELSAHRRYFHWDDVPEDVLAADQGQAVELMRYVGWECLNVNTAFDLAKITTPVFVGYGERNGARYPHREIGYYSGSSDITLLIVPRTGHCHNFSNNRHFLWDRIHRWIEERT